MNGPRVVTFGCRLNAHESTVMEAHAAEAGLQNAVIINTCAVTAEAERQASQTIRRLRREEPHARLIVTGCAAAINPAKYSSMPEVDCVISNDRKMDKDVFDGLGFDRGEPRQVDPLRARQNGEMQRAFIEVQNGCDHRCTFCIIPFGRGASRSVPMEKVAKETRISVDKGYREVVFTGVDIASYGQDLSCTPSLGQMIQYVLDRVPDLPRLRLSSLDPAALDEDLWRLIAEEPRLMPHLHLSLQAGDDMILKRMKRRHLRDDIFALCERARRLRPDIVFGADVIAGFPTETETMFENTYQLIDRCEITWLHVFPYSARKGTPAAKMPQLHGAHRRARAERLRALGARSMTRHQEHLVGRKLDVLVEKEGVGCTPHFAKLTLIGAAPLGAIVSAECERDHEAQIVARVLA